MATYSFKSSGKTQEQLTQEAILKNVVPYGIRTPLKLGNKDGIFIMNTSLETQFADNLRNLLLTNWGERVGLYSFGANLRELTTELSSQENFDSEAIARIKNSVGKWMPFIDLENFSSTIDRTENKNTAVIRLEITYNIPALQAFGKKVQVTLYAI